MFVYILEPDRKQETASDSNRRNPEILPAGERDRLGIIPEQVASIKPAPSDAGEPARRLGCLCCALHQEEGAEGEELNEEREHLDK